MESDQKQLYNSDKEMQATSTTSAPQADAFSKYSNDAIRLKTILLKDDTFDLHGFAGRNYTSTVQKMNLSTVDTSKASNPQDDVEPPRKTRISFEAHPSLIMEDILDDIDIDMYKSIQDTNRRMDDDQDAVNLQKFQSANLSINKLDGLGHSS